MEHLRDTEKAKFKRIISLDIFRTLFARETNLKDIQTFGIIHKVGLKATLSFII